MKCILKKGREERRRRRKKKSSRKGNETTPQTAGIVDISPGHLLASRPHQEWPGGEHSKEVNPSERDTARESVGGDMREKMEEINRI